MRVGFGYDSHVFEAGRKLHLATVAIDGCDGLMAHSDGDVAVHALIDALYGAAALGDIGSHFPDSDEKWRNADSARLLAQAVADVNQAGYEVGNVDIAIVCEKPRIAPYVAAMKENLARLLHVQSGAVSIKGKTNEKMDDVGAGKGIVSYAAVLLNEKKTAAAGVSVRP